MDPLYEIASFIDRVLPEFLEIIIFGLLFFFLERINPAEKETKFFKDDMKNELFLATVNILIFIPIGLFLATLFIEMVVTPVIKKQMFAEQITAMPLMIQIILGAVILDFATYWRHRFTHHYMWSYHSVHHSAGQLTWISGLRLHPMDVFAGIMFSSLVLHIVGFSGAGFLGALIFIKFMNYFTHMNLDLKFDKPLRYIICSPAFHRWHHANVVSAYNTNYCGAFPFLDILFGTYYHPEELPPKYGLSAGEQKNFPEKGYLGWLTYPLKRDYRYFKRKLKNNKKIENSEVQK